MLSKIPESMSIPEIAGHVQNLYLRLKKMKEDDEISYSDLSKIVNKNVQFEGRNLLDKARRMVLKQDKKVIEVVRGEGLKCLNDSSITKIAESERKAIKRKSKRAVNKLKCIKNYSDLTEQEKLNYIAGLCHLEFISTIASEKAYKKLTVSVSVNDVMDFTKTLKAFQEVKES
jgi:hypothetical protein